MQIVTKREQGAIHISDNINFKSKIVIRDKESHNIITKGSINQESETIINIYAQTSEKQII